MIKVNIISERKGSNPGGRCILPYKGNSSLEGYLKYCKNSRLPFGSSFDPIHQPVYEAITLALAEKLGLEVPRYFVLMNNEEKLKFIYDSSIPHKKRLDEKMPYYFVSKLAKLPPQKESEELKKKMRDEKLYRDLLMVGDISNKRQNYAFIHDDSKPHILYIDLGCSFVDAVDGYLSQRSGVSNLLDHKGHSKNLLKTSLRKAKDYLRNKAIITAHKEEYKQDIIELVDLINFIPDISIPLFPRGYTGIDILLHEEEIEEIMNLLTLNIEKRIRQYGNEGHPSICI